MSTVSTTVPLEHCDNSTRVQVIPDFADDFTAFSPKGSTGIFVLPESFKADADKALKAIPQGGNCQFSIQYASDGNPASIKVRAVRALAQHLPPGGLSHISCL